MPIISDIKWFNSKIIKNIYNTNFNIYDNTYNNNRKIYMIIEFQKINFFCL